MIWFTADTHFGHRNIVKYCGRPFKKIEEHDQAIVDNWNERVKDGDTVYHLGDFGMPQGFDHPKFYLMSIRARLNGQVHLLRGNHDKMIKGPLADTFVTISDYKRIKAGPKPRHGIVLCHYAFRTWHGSGRGTWNLHGHSHGNLEQIDTMLQMDVGVDCHGFAPISYDEVKEMMSKRTFKPVDHHGR